MAGTITHQWNGTILTITSDSGTSAMDLKGAKGDDGARGAMGLPGDANLIDAVAAAEKAAADAETALNQLGTARDEAVIAAAQVKAIVAGNEAYTKAESDSRFANAIKPTVKDNIVSITDAAAAPTVEAISHIEPLQAGSGTPYPNNIRDISGWDTAKLYRTGKNLFSGGNDITFTQRKTITLTTPIEPGTYTISANITSDDTDSTYCLVGFSGGNQDGSILYATMDRKTNSVSTKTIYNRVNTIYLNASNSYGTGEGDTATFKDLQIELGTAATAYEPYNGVALTATMPQTIYGGTYDFITGTLNKTYEYLVMDGITEGKKFNATESTTGATAYISRRYQSEYAKPNGTIISNQSNSVRITATGVIIAALPQSLTGVVSTDNSTDVVNKFNTACSTLYSAGTPLVFIYERETPETIQLTPQLVETQYGNNNAWSNCGETTLTYVADTKLYIDNKLATLTNALVSLGGNI